MNYEYFPIKYNECIRFNQNTLIYTDIENLINRPTYFNLNNNKYKFEYKNTKELVLLDYRYMKIILNEMLNFMNYGLLSKIVAYELELIPINIDKYIHKLLFNLICSCLFSSYCDGYIIPKCYNNTDTEIVLFKNNELSKLFKPNNKIINIKSSLLNKLMYKLNITLLNRIIYKIKNNNQKILISNYLPTRYYYKYGINSFPWKQTI